MAAIESNPLYLYSPGTPTGLVLGSLRFASLGPPWSTSERALRFQVTYQPGSAAGPSGSVVLCLDPHVESAVDHRTLGRLTVDATSGSTGELLGNREFTVGWLWQLTFDDIEVIERQRAQIGLAAHVVFRVEVAGVGTNGTAPVGFHGDTQVVIAAPEWVDLIHALGYATPASLHDLVGQSMTGSVVWTAARDKLAKARRQLALGEDHEALQSAYAIFDAALSTSRSRGESVVSSGGSVPNSPSGARSCMGESSPCHAPVSSVEPMKSASRGPIYADSRAASSHSSRPRTGIRTRWCIRGPESLWRRKCRAEAAAERRRAGVDLLHTLVSFAGQGR
jgi:hypothetical protein